MNCNHHDEDDLYDPCEDPCAQPVDPCAARFKRDAAYNRRVKRETGTIILIGVLIAVAAVATFALFATGVLVWNSVDDDRVVGEPATGDCNRCGGDKEEDDKPSSVVINTDKIIIDKKHKDKNRD